MVSSAGVTVAKGACHLLNTFSIIQITKSAGVKIKVNTAHPTHHLEGRLKQGELKYKIQKYKYTNTDTQIQIHKYKYTNANAQIHKYTNTQIRKYANTQINK